MGKFREIAEQIARRMLEEKITAKLLPEILQVDDVFGHSEQGIDGSAINCYPGFPGKDQCHPFAVFVSLSGPLHSGTWWFTYPRILSALVQHFSGACRGKTREGVVITDTWECWAFEEWKTTIENIKRDGVYLEFYLIGKGWVTEIPI